LIFEGSREFINWISLADKSSDVQIEITRDVMADADL
jgi:hypothetical protein